MEKSVAFLKKRRNKYDILDTNTPKMKKESLWKFKIKNRFATPLS